MEHSSLPNYYSGISGLQLPIPKSAFPEEFQSATRLHYYSTLFNSIEFNTTFYKLLKPSTVGKWCTEVKEEFKLTFKLWKQVTHNKKLAFDKEDVRRFFATIEPAGNKKGGILIQLPPGIRIDHHNELVQLLTTVRQCDPQHSWDTAVEFRHTSWYCQQVYDLLENFQMTLVFHDKSRSATPFFDNSFDFIYLRFHGPEGDYKGSYSRDFLSEYATYINEWLAAGKKVYVYFNNTMGDALGNLNTLNQFVLSGDKS